MKFKKAILQVGTYHAPKSNVVVTPERLRHWANQFTRLQAAKQVVPIDWDHSSSESDLTPLTMDAYQKKRSAKNTIGHLHEFKVSEDGQRAELLLDVPDKAAAQKAKDNLVYVSPVIFPTWKDGTGAEYQDCITHVDFVNHPVDHSQGKFEPVEAGAIACAIRMSLSEPMRLAFDGDDKSGDSDGDSDGGSDNDADDSNDSDSDDKPDGIQDDEGRLKDVITALGGMSIVLSGDTTPANFLAHLHQALLTAAAHRGEGPTNQQQDQNPNPGGDITVADQGNVALSLEQRQQVQQGQIALAYAEGVHRKGVTDRLKGLIDSGRCTPPEFQSRSAEIGAVRLSLDTAGKPQSSDLEKWIESREAVPAGTFWDPETRLNAQRLSVAQPTVNTGELTREQVDELADWALGKPAKK